jgi:hypothetical protein
MSFSFWYAAAAGISAANLENIALHLDKLPPVSSQQGNPKNRYHNPYKLPPLASGPGNLKNRDHLTFTLSNDLPPLYWDDDLNTTKDDSKITKFDSE